MWMPDLSDDELLQRYHQGDAAAFKELLARHQRRLFAFLLRMVGERALAEDLFQETFFRLAREASRGKVRDNVGRWLFTVAHRLALNALKRRLRWKLVGVDAANDETPAALNEPRAQEMPDEQLVRLEMNERLERAIAALPSEQRAVVLLKRDGEMTCREIAEQLSVPLGTVLSRVQRAMKSLREAMMKQPML